MRKRFVLSTALIIMALASVVVAPATASETFLPDRTVLVDALQPDGELIAQPSSFYGLMATLGVHRAESGRPMLTAFVGARPVDIQLASIIPTDGGGLALYRVTTATGAAFLWPYSGTPQGFLNGRDFLLWGSLDPRGEFIAFGIEGLQRGQKPDSGFSLAGEVVSALPDGRRTSFLVRVGVGGPIFSLVCTKGCDKAKVGRPNAFQGLFRLGGRLVGTVSPNGVRPAQ